MHGGLQITPLSSYLSVVVFAGGSLACSAAPTMPALIATRALQGIGGSGLVVTAISALGEMFDRDELVRRQIWLTTVTAISAIAGPPIGGFLAAGPGWRWIFLVNLPICAVAIALAIQGLPRQDRRVALSGFDWFGAALIATIGTGVVTLGSSASVASSPLWAPLILAAVFLGTIWFVRVERRAASPLIPLDLFSNRPLARTIAVTGLTGMTLFGTYTFVSLAAATVAGANTGMVGTLLLALTGGQLAVTTAFSFVARRFPRMTAWGGLGLVLGVAGLVLLAAVPLLRDARFVATALAVGGMALTGAALGLSMQAYTLFAQTIAPRDSFGAAMGTLTFSRQLGGSLGTAAFGWILLTVTPKNVALAVVLWAAALITGVSGLVAPRETGGGG